jgi:hypothetical protein
MTVGLLLLGIAAVAGAQLWRKRPSRFSCVDTAASGSVMASADNLAVHIEWSPDASRVSMGRLSRGLSQDAVDGEQARQRAQALLEPIRAGLRSSSRATVELILICDGRIETWYGAPPAPPRPWSDCFHDIGARYVPGCLQARLNHGRPSGGDEQQAGAVRDRILSCLANPVVPAREIE